MQQFTDTTNHLDFVTMETLARKIHRDYSRNIIKNYHDIDPIVQNYDDALNIVKTVLGNLNHAVRQGYELSIDEDVEIDPYVMDDTDELSKVSYKVIVYTIKGNQFSENDDPENFMDRLSFISFLSAHIYVHYLKSYYVAEEMLDIFTRAICEEFHRGVHNFNLAPLGLTIEKTYEYRMSKLHEFIVKSI